LLLGERVPVLRRSEPRRCPLRATDAANRPRTRTQLRLLLTFRTLLERRTRRLVRLLRAGGRTRARRWRPRIAAVATEPPRTRRRRRAPRGRDGDQTTPL